VPLLALTILLSVILGQTGHQWYPGTWTAEFEGTTFVRLELTETDGGPAGRISLGDIEVSPDGALRKATAAPSRLTVIFDAVMRDSTLSFSRKDGNDTDRFELQRVGDHAELVLVPTEELKRQLDAENIPIPKPIRLKRVPG
jgi:hypothetical protein